MKGKCCIRCDLKSFYASVECVGWGLDPMTTNLVVTDKRRTDKTIYPAITPSLKAYGISDRTRLFEVAQKAKEVNLRRQRQVSDRQLVGASWNDPEVRENPALALDYLVAPPRMAHYIGWSTKVYNVYLKYVTPKDIFPYSINEVFIDLTHYLDTYKITTRGLTQTILLDILNTTGIIAAAGTGGSLYLAKVATDIMFKHIRADRHGVRIAKLAEESYRRLLWTHRPLTDFWRVDKGYVGKLEANGLYTMGDIVRCSIGKPTDYHNEELLCKLFGVDVEILIDHAWGWEPYTVADVKTYKPENESIVSGQASQRSYDFDRICLVVWEMADALTLDLVDKRLMTNQLMLTAGYDRENLDDPDHCQNYHGLVITNRYRRNIPKHAMGTKSFIYTSPVNDLRKTAAAFYDRIVDKNLLIRRLSISTNKLPDEAEAPEGPEAEQLDLLTDYSTREQREQGGEVAHAREWKLQEVMLGIKKRHGESAILKGTNLEDGATAKECNQTIGGHQT